MLGGKKLSFMGRQEFIEKTAGGLASPGFTQDHIADASDGSSMGASDQLVKDFIAKDIEPLTKAPFAADETDIPHPTPVGSLPEATDYIFGEMIRNVRSPEVEDLQQHHSGLGDLQKLYGLYEFSRKVGSGKKWDHKRTLKSGMANKEQSHTFKGNPSQWFYSKEEDASYSFDIFSNIHYGYITAAIGYERNVVVDAAGSRQERTAEGAARVREFRRTISQPNELPIAYGRRVKWGDRGWDPPEDQSAILLGRHLYEKYGRDLTREQFELELSYWPDLAKRQGVQPPGAPLPESLK